MTCETLIDCVIISKRSEAAKILFWQVLILNFSMSIVTLLEDISKFQTIVKLWFDLLNRSKAILTWLRKTWHFVLVACDSAELHTLRAHPHIPLTRHWYPPYAPARPRISPIINARLMSLRTYASFFPPMRATRTADLLKLKGIYIPLLLKRGTRSNRK